VNWVLAVIGALLSAELFLRLRITSRVRRVTIASRKAARTVRSHRVSDHWKERVLPVFARQIIVGSLAFLALLLCAVAPIILLGVFIEGGIAVWLQQLLRPGMVAVLVVVSISHIVIRQKFSRV